MNAVIIALGQLLPIAILLVGFILLLVKKKQHDVFFAICGLLLLEVIAYLKISWTLYFSGPLYLVLIHSLYGRLFFVLLKKEIFRILVTMLLIIAIVGVLFIHEKNKSFVFYYVAGNEMIVLLYPVLYFLRLMKQSIKYELKYFVLNSIVLLFFSLEIILYIMLKFLSDYYSLITTNIVFFRFFVIQLFYISLIYFGCKLSKK